MIVVCTMTERKTTSCYSYHGGGGVHREKERDTNQKKNHFEYLRFSPEINTLTNYYIKKKIQIFH